MRKPITPVPTHTYSPAYALHVLNELSEEISRHYCVVSALVDQLKPDEKDENAHHIAYGLAQALEERILDRATFNVLHEYLEEHTEAEAARR